MCSRNSCYISLSSLPVVLRVALLLLACGLCRHMCSINLVAFTLISLTGLEVAFYDTVITGMLSYACPFQTPALTALRGLWKGVRRGIVSLTIHYPRVLLPNRRMWNRGARLLFQYKPQPTTIPLRNIEVHQYDWILLRKPVLIVGSRQQFVSPPSCHSPPLTSSLVTTNPAPLIATSQPEARDVLSSMLGGC